MKRANQHGFTLIEVLVALSIVAIALFAGTQATSALARSSQRQTDLLLAQICIDNTFHGLRLAKQFPDIGERNIECSQAGRVFNLQLKVNPSANPNVRAVQTTVSDVERGYGILQITSIIGR